MRSPGEILFRLASLSEKAPCDDEKDWMRPQIAYLISQYPAINHTFMLREVRQMTDLGWEAGRFNIRSPDRSSGQKLRDRLEVEVALYRHLRQRSTGADRRSCQRAAGHSSRRRALTAARKRVIEDTELRRTLGENSSGT